MSHEIETAVFMASEGAGWTGLGRAIPLKDSRDPAKIATLCNADFTVDAEPLYRKNAKGIYVQVPDVAAQVRSDNGHCLSVTSDNRYHTDHRQPRDVFEAFRDDLAKQSLEISHAAVLRGGATIAVSAILPPEFDTRVNGFDRMRRYITLSTGYDRKHGTSRTRGFIRVVCANTLAMSLSEGAQNGTLKTIRASTKLESYTLREMIQHIVASQEEERAAFDAMANTRVSDADVARYFADVLEIDIADLNKTKANGKPALSTKSQNMLATLTNAYQSAPGAQTAKGSIWGALNAVTYFATHEKTCRDTSGDGPEVTRIASNMTGDSARLKARALALAAQRSSVQMAVAA